MKLLLLALFGIATTIALETSEIEVANANTKFANNLYNVISKAKPGDDVFFSPLGVHTVLSMLYQGAGDSTKEALTTTLQVKDPQSTAEGYHEIMTNLNNVPNVTLHIANKIYVQENFNIYPEYKEVVFNKFQSAIDNVDFEKSQEAAQTVNNWVKDKTNGKIEKLFEKSDFTSDTRLVLLNAIYFKGSWSTKFEKSDTRTEPFFVNENTQTDVQMMHRTGAYNYKNDFVLNAQVVELPFQNHGVSMFIVLPFEKYGINELEAKVQEHGLERVFSGMHYDEELIVAVPKFKLETTIKLDDPLKELGLAILYDAQDCDLKNIASTGGNLYVSKAIQKAFIEFNEEGAEAAAATGIATNAFMLRRDYFEFYANHPFLVVLKEANNVLFYGKILKPVSGDPDVAPTAEPSYHKYTNVVIREWLKQSLGNKNN